MRIADGGGGQFRSWYITAKTTAGSPYVRMKPFRGGPGHVAFEARWSTASTAGSVVSLWGAISSDSTNPVRIGQVKSTQKSVQIGSTSGAASKVFAWVRYRSSAGTFSTSKWARVSLVTSDFST